MKMKRQSTVWDLINVCDHCGRNLHTKIEYEQGRCGRCQEEYDEEMYAMYGVEEICGTMIKREDELGWLKEAIVSYVQTHERADSVGLASYMKLRIDITLTALSELIEEGQIDKYWNGRYYALRVAK